MSKRTTAVDTAQCWFDSSRDPSNSMSDRLIQMENVYNHTENALFAAREDIEKLHGAMRHTIRQLEDAKFGASREVLAFTLAAALPSECKTGEN